MRYKKLPHIAVFAILFTVFANAFAQEDPALFLGRANARVARAMAFRNNWEGPTAGPKLASNKLIVLITGDMSEPNHPADRAQEEIKNSLDAITKSINWSMQVINCYGAPNRRSDAFSRALALNPAAIILAGVDASAQSKEMGMAAAKKIPVIGWHAALSNGPSAGLFTNIGTDPKEVGQLAALLSVVESKAKEGVVVFADSSSYYNTTKSAGVTEIIKQCQTCNLLSVEQVPLNEKADKMAERVAGLVKQYGSKWTHLIAITDRFLDTMSDPSVIKALGDTKISAIAAGDGASTAYLRIREKSLQLGTVPEPIDLQAYQLIDEANRAIAGEKPSGFVTPSYVVTLSNVAYHGGPKNMFEPTNGYRDEYRKIWTR